MNEPMEQNPSRNKQRHHTRFKPFNEYKAENTLSVLTNNIESIPDVQSWAEKAQVSKNWLSKTMKDAYGMLPKDILREARYEKIIQLICNNIEATAYCIAKDSGLPSENSLRMFLLRYKQTNFRELRRQILTDELSLEWKWLQKE